MIIGKKTVSQLFCQINTGQQNFDLPSTSEIQVSLQNQSIQPQKYSNLPPDKTPLSESKQKEKVKPVLPYSQLLLVYKQFEKNEKLDNQVKGGSKPLKFNNLVAAESSPNTKKPLKAKPLTTSELLFMQFKKLIRERKVRGQKFPVDMRFKLVSEMTKMYREKADLYEKERKKYIKIYREFSQFINERKSHKIKHLTQNSQLILMPHAFIPMPIKKSKPSPTFQIHHSQIPKQVLDQHTKEPQQIKPKPPKRKFLQKILEMKAHKQLQRQQVVVCLHYQNIKSFARIPQPLTPVAQPLLYATPKTIIQQHIHAQKKLKFVSQKPISVNPTPIKVTPPHITTITPASINTSPCAPTSPPLISSPINLSKHQTKSSGQSIGKHQSKALGSSENIGQHQQILSKNQRISGKKNKKPSANGQIKPLSITLAQKQIKQDQQRTPRTNAVELLQKTKKLPYQKATQLPQDEVRQKEQKDPDFIRNVNFDQKLCNEKLSLQSKAPATQRQEQELEHIKQAYSQQIQIRSPSLKQKTLVDQKKEQDPEQIEEVNFDQQLWNGGLSLQSKVKQPLSKEQLIQKAGQNQIIQKNDSEIRLQPKSSRKQWDSTIRLKSEGKETARHMATQSKGQDIKAISSNIKNVQPNMKQMQSIQQLQYSNNSEVQPEKQLKEEYNYQQQFQPQQENQQSLMQQNDPISLHSKVVSKQEKNGLNQVNINLITLKPIPESKQVQLQPDKPKLNQIQILEAKSQFLENLTIASSGKQGYDENHWLQIHTNYSLQQLQQLSVKELQALNGRLSKQLDDRRLLNRAQQSEIHLNKKEVFNEIQEQEDEECDQKDSLIYSKYLDSKMMDGLSLSIQSKIKGLQSNISNGFSLGMQSKINPFTSVIQPKKSKIEQIFEEDSIKSNSDIALEPLDYSDIQYQ